MKVKIKRLHRDARIPEYATDGSAAVDLYSVGSYYIKADGFVTWVRTGIAIELPKGYYAELYNRSGLAAKKQVIVVSSRIIDTDYRGEIFVPMRVIDDMPAGYIIPLDKGDRVAQMIVKKYEKVEFEEVDELTETLRGDGGFGSTGK